MSEALILLRLVDLAILILVVEALALLLGRLRPVPRHGLPAYSIALIALAGLGLLMALRAALAGAPVGFVLAGLTLGGLAHGADLTLRLRAARTQKR